MSKLRSVSTSFWSDPFIEELSPSEKLLYLYFITNDKTNMLGIYELSVKKISFETGVPKETVLKALELFESKGKVKYVENFIVLTKFMKHQNFNTNMKKSAIDCHNNLPKSLKIKGINLSLTNPIESFETLSNHYGMVRKVEVELETELEVETEKEIEVEPISSGKPPVHPSYGFIKECFLAYYLEQKKDSYYFKPIDGKKINSIIEQLKFKISEKNTREKITLDDDKFPEQINLGFEYLLGNINDQWIKDNLSLSIIDSKFNEIISKIINNGKDGKPKRLVDEAGERLRNNQYS